MLKSDVFMWNCAVNTVMHFWPLCPSWPTIVNMEDGVGSIEALVSDGIFRNLYRGSCSCSDQR